MLTIDSLILNFTCLLLILIQQCSSAQGWGNDERVSLKDVESLTLFAGRMSTARRGSPVPQLHCVGGSVGCSAFQPQVVQCINRGFDGISVNWECKTDMDNDYRFGSIEVTCEGYDYPGDKYILAGSCGLEYTIDYTKAGRSQRSSDYDWGQRSHNSFSVNVLGDLIFYIVVGIIIYLIYKSCVTGASARNQYSTTDEDYPGYPPSGQGPRGSPPPAGFRPEYGYGGGDSDSCGGARRSRQDNPYGFWTGAGLGGLFGYLMGNRNQNYYGGNYYQRNPGYSWGSGRSSSYYRTSSSSSPGSSGTRTASGFGTSRVR